jgi:hypothetical protein
MFRDDGLQVNNKYDYHFKGPGFIKKKVVILCVAVDLVNYSK